MTYMEWITRVEKYRVMEYMKLSYSEKSKIRANYTEWFRKHYHREPAPISI